MEVNRNANKKNITFLTSFIEYWIIFDFFPFKNSRENRTNTSLDRTLLTFLFFLFSYEIIFFSFFLSKMLAYYSRWHQFKIVVFFLHIVFLGLRYYCAFQKHELWSSKAAFTIGYFSLPSVIIRITSNEPWNTQTHKSQTMTFSIRWSKLLFPNRSAKMIDGKREMAFELQ